jgi:uncharacterized RDD family membrane protein YckC
VTRRTIGRLLRRSAAYGVDILILALVLIPLAFAIQAMTGYRADSGIGVWLASVVTISVPSWAYFAISDASASGATIGKRLFGLRIVADDNGRMRPGTALLRTAIKLIPWELTHLTMFALSPRLGTFSGLQLALLWVVYGSLAAYLIVALRNQGERSIHDLVAGSSVRPRTA